MIVHYEVISLYTNVDIDLLEKYSKKYLEPIMVNGISNRLEGDIVNLRRYMGNDNYQKPLVYLIDIGNRKTMYGSIKDLKASHSLNGTYDNITNIHDCKIFKNNISYKKKIIL